MSAIISPPALGETTPVTSEAPSPGLVLDKKAWHEAVVPAVAEHRTGEPLSVLFVDANYFSDVNNELGHDMGDVVIEDIRGLVSALTSTSRTKLQDGEEPRPLDIVTVTPISEEPEPVEIIGEEPVDSELIDLEGGHIGGDEFAILAHTDEAGTKVIMQRFRQLFADYIENSPNREALEKIGLGLAIGSATLGEDMTSSDLLRAADQAMYRDKYSQLPEATRYQRIVLRLSRFALEKSGVRLRDVPKYWHELPR